MQLATLTAAVPWPLPPVAVAGGDGRSIGPNGLGQETDFGLGWRAGAGRSLQGGFGAALHGPRARRIGR